MPKLSFNFKNMEIQIFKLILIAVLLVSCSDKKKKEKIIKNPDTIESTENFECFAYTQNEDTIYMKFTEMKDSTVSGSLTYNFYGKDRNKGEFKGKWSGDSLFADYQFQSEGSVSTREIFFFKTEAGLIEGYGPVKDTLNKVVFQEHRTLVLNENILLKPVDCN